MGADIHSLVERKVLIPRWTDRDLRRRQRKGALERELYTVKWEEVKLLEWRECWDFAQCNHDYTEHYINHAPDITPWYKDRHYAMFGVLGNVRPRGGRPYDGHYRGLPEGCSDPEWGDYYHSITWYMCTELGIGR